MSALIDRSRAADGAHAGTATAVGEDVNRRTEWFCERWTQEAVDFAAQKLAAKGIKYVEHGYQIDPAQGIVVPKIVRVDQGQIPSALLRQIIGAPDDGEDTVHGNLLLNEGIAVLLDLTFATASPTAYANANAQLGVGDSTTAESASQTDLQASTNKLFVGMNATYPSRSAQTVTAQSDFTSGQANYAWQEVSLRNSSGSDKNLNRKVTSLGTKATGTWTLSLAITLS